MEIVAFLAAGLMSVAIRRTPQHRERLPVHRHLRDVPNLAEIQDKASVLALSADERQLCDILRRSREVSNACIAV